MNNKTNDFVRNILQNNFSPTVASCYPVHADAHLSAAMLCYLRAAGAKTSLLLTAYCIE